MKQCVYCGSTRSIQEEHVRAFSKGGSNTILACRKCNQSKGDKPLMEWLRWVKHNDRYRWNRIEEFNYQKKGPIAKKVHKIRDET